MGLHIPWKKIGKGAEKVIQAGAIFDPDLAAVAALIEVAETSVLTSGPDKKAMVMAGARALIAAKLQGLPALTAAQQAAIDAAISQFIDSYVAVRNAIEAVKAA